MEAELARELTPGASLAPRLDEAMRYAATGGGKRARAALLVLVCEHLGGARSDARVAACAVELVHAYSLAHDDLPCMDNDPLRRGRPSCHMVFGDWLALLAGDALQSRAFELLAQLAPEQAGPACAVLARAIGSQGMAGGQALDMAAERREARSAQARAPELAAVQAMHAGKTAALLAAACELGALCARAGATAREQARRMGWELGLAFQAVDDVLDVEGSAAELGKTAGKDARGGKQTLVAAVGLEGARAIAAAHTAAALEWARSLGAREAGLLWQCIESLLARRR
jgi:farnesyl diphosphate synthase